MTDSERIDRLEQLVIALADALRRSGTEQDGNWGYPGYREVLEAIIRDLTK